MWFLWQPSFFVRIGSADIVAAGMIKIIQQRVGASVQVGGEHICDGALVKILVPFGAVDVERAFGYKRLLILPI